MSSNETPVGFKPKKSVALSGQVAGNTALCTVGRSGNDLHYRGYDILDLAVGSQFEEVAHLLVHGKLPNDIKGNGDKLRQIFFNNNVVKEELNLAQADKELAVPYLKTT